jgi:hypothetical protein
MVIGCENANSRVVRVESKASKHCELGGIDAGVQRSFLMGDRKTIELSNKHTV